MKFIFKPKWRRFTSAVQIPLTIVLVAFALRVATIVAEHTYQVPIRGRGWYFAYEMGAIAGSVASGRGFRSPFCAACGPTAWVGPIYPLLLAGIFKVFGAYTNLSAFVSLAVNSIFGAVNALVIFHIARDIFDRRVALISAWIWAVLPYAIFWPTHWIWDTSLSALLLSVAFLWTLRLAGETDRAKWFEFGLFWALIALTNASLLSFLPVSVGWLGWHLRRQEAGRGIPIAVLTIAFVVGISPWVIRNYLVFGSLVPLRDLGEELFAGNHEGGNGLYYEVKRWNLSELQRVGELRFVAERRQMALHFITTHPGDFAIFVAKRFGYFWCDLPRGWHVPHFGTGTRQALHFTFALTSFWGVWEAYRRKRKGTFLFLVLFAIYPLVYYITHVQPRFQHPITPEMLIVSVYLFSVSAGQPSTLALAWRKMTSTRHKA